MKRVRKNQYSFKRTVGDTCDISLTITPLLRITMTKQISLSSMEVHNAGSIYI
jgi:hypothetical protein